MKTKEELIEMVKKIDYEEAIWQQVEKTDKEYLTITYRDNEEFKRIFFKPIESFPRVFKGVQYDFEVNEKGAILFTGAGNGWFAMDETIKALKQAVDFAIEIREKL